jgi:hypothetical protein
MGDMVMDKPDEKINESFVLIKFENPGSVNMSVSFNNVIPLQVAAAAWFLEKQAETGFFQQQMEQQQREAQQQIAVPKLVRK